MLDWDRCGSVERCTGRVSGTYVFRGTQVPVMLLFENLEDGASIEEFLSWFPGVDRQHVVTVLEFAGQSLTVA